VEIALEQLNLLSKGKDRVGIDARSALQWLDDVTSDMSIQSAGTIHLQEPGQSYASWEEVENYLLPSPLLSIDGHQNIPQIEPEDHSKALFVNDDSDKESLNLSQPAELRQRDSSSPQSACSARSPVSREQKTTVICDEKEKEEVSENSSALIERISQLQVTSSQAIPVALRSLFNHVIWLINQDKTSDAALVSYVLLTNNACTHIWAQKFGVKVKRLEQIREVIAREDREYRNRLQLFQKEIINGTINPSHALLLQSRQVADIHPKESASDDDDVVQFQSHNSDAIFINEKRILDPEEFVRTPNEGIQLGRQAGRRSGGGPVKRGESRVISRRSRELPNTSVAASLSHDQFVGHQQPHIDALKAQTIDPDSFARPSPSRRGLRGGRRKLWEPA
jgi:hypothetical protein